MKRILLISITLSVISMLASAAQERINANNDKRFSFAHQIDFNATLDNREYHTDLDYSRTIFAASLDAAVGLGIKGGKTMTHRLMTGASALYAFGGDISAKWLIYYQFDATYRKNKFRLIGGSFSRNLSQAYYSYAFFDLANRIYDSNYEGFQFSWTGRNFYYEIGLDWKGELRQKAPDVREEFMVYSGGSHRINPFLKFGYSARFHHYANSWNLDQMKRETSNVVDDILVNPYLDADFAFPAKMQKMLLRVGYLQAFERDRNTSDNILTPARGEFLIEARKWNVGIVNDFFFGGELMPFYDYAGADGRKYGSNLYMGDPMMRNPDGKSFGIYDKVSIYYEPNLAHGLKLRLQIDAHFNNSGFAGWNQMIFLIYQLPQDIFHKK